MRVLIVDDSAFMRKIIKEMILSDGSIEVVGTARDGVEGVAKAIELRPDLITMDIEMPRMNGIDALRQIMIQCSDHTPAVLMCSSMTVDGSIETLKALRIGASDFIAKDAQIAWKLDPEFQKQLLAKIHAIGNHHRGLRRSKAARLGEVPSQTAPGTASGACTSFDDLVLPHRIDAIVVGSSTGGPPALEEIFTNLPATLPVPIFVAQHIPELFSRSLAQRLDTLCACGATLAQHGTRLDKPGIYIVQGGKHLKPTRIAGRTLIARLIEEYPGARSAPSVDLLFSTAAELFGPNLLAIQLTGMGEDGAIGAKQIKASGGTVIAQNADSCVVYGMPRAVVEGGHADAILTPDNIHRVLKQVCQAAEHDKGVGRPTDRMIA